MSFTYQTLSGLDFTDDLTTDRLSAMNIDTQNIQVQNIAPKDATQNLEITGNIVLKSDNVIIGTGTNNAGVCNIRCNQVYVGDGQVNPAGVAELFFNADGTGAKNTGFRGDGDAVLTVIGGSDVIRTTNSGIQLNNGTLTQPSLFFAGNLTSGLAFEPASSGTNVLTSGGVRCTFGFNRITYANSSITYNRRLYTGSSPLNIANNDSIVVVDNNTWTGTYNVQLTNTSVPVEGMWFCIIDPYARGNIGAGRILRFDATNNGTTTAIYVNGVNNRKWEFNYGTTDLTIACFYCSRITGGNIYLNTEARLNPVP